MRRISVMCNFGWFPSGVHGDVSRKVAPWILACSFLATLLISHVFGFHECTHIDEHTALVSEQMLSVAAPCPWLQLGGHCGGRIQNDDLNTVTYLIRLCFSFQEIFERIFRL
ncbi:uncharacterized protein [Lolium perenne]|uniref:uncharacterized protein n=1 Tax=Lolium perenne TaxID=4522 RepID=UPI003A98D5F9